MYALVTGASSGIGKYCALDLAKRRFNLVITARSIDKLEELKKEITEKYNKDVLVFKADLEIIDDIYSLFEFTKNLDINVVINNAGLGKVGLFNEINDKDDINMINVNVTAMHLIMKHYADTLDNGYILTVASIASFAPGPKMATYYATKNYIRSYAEALRFELKKMKKKVYISILAPGPVDTNFNNVANAKLALKGVDANKCACYAVKRMFKKKKFSIPSFFVRTGSRFMRIIPNSWSMSFCFKSQNKKDGK